MNSDMMAAFAMRIGDLSFLLGVFVQELNQRFFNEWFSITTSYGMGIRMSIFSYVLVFTNIFSFFLSNTFFSLIWMLD